MLSQTGLRFNVSTHRNLKPHQVILHEGSLQVKTWQQMFRNKSTTDPTNPTPNKQFPETCQEFCSEWAWTKSAEPFSPVWKLQCYFTSKRIRSMPGLKQDMKLHPVINSTVFYWERRLANKCFDVFTEALNILTRVAETRSSVEILNRFKNLCNKIPLWSCRVVVSFINTSGFSFQIFLRTILQHQHRLKTFEASIDHPGIKTTLMINTFI